MHIINVRSIFRGGEQIYTESGNGLKSGLNTLQTLFITGERHCQTYLSQQLHLMIKYKQQKL